MRAIRFEGHGGYEELTLADVPAPERGEGEVLVARTFVLEEAPEAQRYLVEDRPFGKVVLTI